MTLLLLVGRYLKQFFFFFSDTRKTAGTKYECGFSYGGTCVPRIDLSYYKQDGPAGNASPWLRLKTITGGVNTRRFLV